jgi:RNA polymerase sigma-70 factor (ECF subfamily)
MKALLTSPRNLFPFSAVNLYGAGSDCPGENWLKAPKKEAEDERLLIEAAQRDPSRFAELYERNFERVYAFVASRVHNRAEAEDVTSEIFHRALANLRRFEWRGVPFAAWLYRLAANAVADRRQRAGREAELPASADAIEDPVAMRQVEERAILFGLVSELAPDQRRVVIMRFVEQKSIREIARELRRSEGAVKQLQFRALGNLRARLRRAHA